MNRRDFFKAAGAVMLGGMIPAQAQPNTELDVEPIVLAWQEDQLSKAEAAYDEFVYSLHAASQQRLDNVGLSAEDVAAQVRRELERMLTFDEIEGYSQ